MKVLKVVDAITTSPDAAGPREPAASLSLGGHLVGPGRPCFVIAEAGVNHNGDKSIAREMIAAVAETGASAIKFQTFNARKLVTASAPCARYQNAGQERNLSQLELLKRLELSAESFLELKQEAEKRGLIFLSSPFEEESADLLERIGVCAYKVPSGEITNIPFLEHLAKKKRPLIMSTGMSCLSEVETAVDACYAAGNPDIILLHCVSRYPADPAEINLRCMQTLRDHFGLAVGYSDHTVGIEVALAAVALGACVIEKHFTLSRALDGPDHVASIEPQELKALVAGIRAVSLSLGDGHKRPSAGEEEVTRVARKSVVARVEIRAGELIRPEHLCLMRPGTGLPGSVIPQLLARRALGDIPAGTLIALEMLEPAPDRPAENEPAVDSKQQEQGSRTVRH